MASLKPRCTRIASTEKLQHVGRPQSEWIFDTGRVEAANVSRSAGSNRLIWSEPQHCLQNDSFLQGNGLTTSSLQPKFGAVR